MYLLEHITKFKIFQNVYKNFCIFLRTLLKKERKSRLHQGFLAVNGPKNFFE